MVVLEEVRQQMLDVLAKSPTGIAWLLLPPAVKVTEADVRAIALIQFILEQYPEMELADFHRLLYDARWGATCLVASQPPLDDCALWRPATSISVRLLDESGAE